MYIYIWRTIHTYLRPNQFCQTPDKLRCSVNSQPQCFLVNDLSDCEPESCFEALFAGGWGRGELALVMYRVRGWNGRGCFSGGGWGGKVVFTSSKASSALSSLVVMFVYFCMRVDRVGRARGVGVNLHRWDHACNSQLELGDCTWLWITFGEKASTFFLNKSPQLKIFLVFVWRNCYLRWKLQFSRIWYRKS